MESKTEIKQLLKNIQNGLKKYTVSELSDGIFHYLNKKDDKTKEINHVLSVISEHYNTETANITKKYVHGTLGDAKQIFYCILHFELGLSTRFIANRVFKSNSHAHIYRGILRLKNANVLLKPDKEFIDNYNSIKEKCSKKTKI